MFEAVVFPGQGAQKLGMGQDFYEQFPVAQDVFAKASDTLGYDISKICFEDERKLNQTAYTQPAILTTEVAMFETLKAHHSLSPKWFAGHSLGEYAALVASEVMPFEVALTLVAKRGALMQAAISTGGMTALIMQNIDPLEIKSVVSAFDIDVANDNSLTQLVLSGEKAGLEKSAQVLSERFGDEIRIIPLNVSGPFHSRHMKSIEEEYAEVLKTFSNEIQVEPCHQVVSNVLGGFYPNNARILIEMLAKQLSHGVRWRDNMKVLSDKTPQILELGPNRPLRGFFKTLNLDIAAIINLRSARKYFG